MFLTKIQATILPMIQLFCVPIVSLWPLLIGLGDSNLFNSDVALLTFPPCSDLCSLRRSDQPEEEHPPSHSLSNSKLGLQGLEEEEEEVEGDDEEEEEGSLTEKSHDEAPESPSPVTTGVYEEDEEEEEAEAAPLAMSYEHTRRYLSVLNLQKRSEFIDKIYPNLSQTTTEMYSKC